MSAVTNGASAREPRPAPGMERRFSAQAIAELNEIVSHYPEKRAAMLPALWIAQREYGGALTPAAIGEVAELLERPYAEVEGVASFYTMYNLRRVGRHHIEVCTCLTCACVGAYDVLHRLEERLGIGAGETTPDGEFTVTEAECLNWCEAGTVVQVGERYYGNVTAQSVDALLDELRGGDEHTTTAQADAVVKLHLGAANPVKVQP
jgi:NADH-quinone oxidoreductase E subunit